MQLDKKKLCITKDVKIQDGRQSIAKNSSVLLESRFAALISLR